MHIRLVSLQICVALSGLACASPKSAPNEEPAAAPSADASMPAGEAVPEASAGGGSAEPPPPSAGDPREVKKPEPDAEPARGVDEDRGIRGAEASKTKQSQASLDGLQVAVPAVGGGLGRDIIRRKVSDHLDEVRDCYGRGLEASAELGGALVIHVEIDGDGGVTSTSLGEQNAVMNRSVQDCVLELVEGLRFDAPRGGKATSAELSFSL